MEFPGPLWELVLSFSCVASLLNLTAGTFTHELSQTLTPKLSWCDYSNHQSENQVDFSTNFLKTLG